MAQIQLLGTKKLDYASNYKLNYLDRDYIFTLYCIFRIYSKQYSIQRAQLYFCAQEISSEIKIKENMNI